MYRRLIAVTAVLVITTLAAHAADPARSRQPELPLEESSLRALFDLAPGVIETADPDAGVTVSAFAVEVVVARIGADGKLIKACVDTEEAAQKFLRSPLEKIARTEGHDH